MIKIALIQNRQAGHPRCRRQRKAGFSLGEMMVALLIISILTMCIATSVAFGMKQYNKSMAISEARILNSTLMNAVTDELCNAETDISGTINAKSDGMIYKGNSKLLPDAAYEGTQKLSAEITVAFNDGKYTVTLSVSPFNTDWKVSNTFDVIPLNPVTPVSGS